MITKDLQNAKFQNVFSSVFSPNLGPWFPMFIAGGCCDRSFRATSVWLITTHHSYAFLNSRED